MKPTRFQKQAFRGFEKHMGRTLALSATGEAGIVSGIFMVGVGKPIEGSVVAAVGATIQAVELVRTHRDGKR